MSSNPQVRDVEWVIKNFRPFLQALNVRNISPGYPFNHCILADHRNAHVLGMGRCAIFIRRWILPSNDNGSFVLQHDKEHDVFYLLININVELFTKDNEPTKVRRKLVAIHEYTHSVAALLAISRVRSPLLIASLKEKLRKKAHAITTADISKLITVLSSQFDETNKLECRSQVVFPDEHYRLGDEELPAGYPTVFENLLLSRTLFENYFDKEHQAIFYGHLVNKDFDKAIQTITSCITKICEEKSLDRLFVLQRIKDFILYYLQNAP